MDVHPARLVTVLAQANDDEAAGTGLFGGADILVLLVLALGGALLVGNVLAVLRPPPQRRDGDLDHAPLARTVTMGAVGLVAVVWAAGTLWLG